MSKISNIPEDRKLTAAEYVLVRWLLEHGNESAGSFLSQLEDAKVASRCNCGCASVNFSIEGKTSPETGLHVLSDYQWISQEGYLFGIFIFAKGELLSGLEVWSIDGQATPLALPAIEDLTPIGTSASPSTEEDSLVDKLLNSNTQFHSLVEKSKESPRKPFSVE